jgi:hypothetical protein
VFDPYSRVEKALNSVILESYIQGVSTRNVMNVVESLGLDNISASIQREEGRFCHVNSVIRKQRLNGNHSLMI